MLVRGILHLFATVACGRAADGACERFCIDGMGEVGDLGALGRIALYVATLARGACDARLNIFCAGFLADIRAQAPRTSPCGSSRS